MERFLVSPFSINVLSVVILLLFLLFFLSRHRQKSKATWSLILFLAGVTLVFAAFAVIFSTLNMLHATVAWSVLHLFVFASIAMVQFAYHFPENLHPTESRRALVVCTVAAVLIYPWYLFRLTHLEPTYNFEGFLYAYLNTPEVGIVIGLEIVWMIALFIRKMLVWTRDSGTALWRRLLLPADRRARALRDVMLIFVSPAVLVLAIILAYLDIVSWGVFGHILGSGFIAVAFAFIVVYINNSSEPSSLMIKLVGISLGTVFFVFGIAVNTAIEIKDHGYDRERRLEMEQYAIAITDNDFSRITGLVSYIAEVDSGKVLFKRDPSLNMPTADGTRPRDDGKRYYRMASALDPEDYYLCYRFRPAAGDRYEVGYSYIGYRRELRRACLPLIIALAASALFVVCVFPAFFSRCLVRPMDQLLDGVSKVNDGDLKVRVPVLVEDEIGFLSGSFNRMVESIDKARTDLQATLDHQVRLTRSYSWFVPAQFLEFLDKENITEIRLGDNVQREMTLLFSDIRSFTTLSEQMSPQENFDFINRYLRRIGPVVRENRGFIDKYMGDGVMALFPHTADDAVATAVHMQVAVAGFNADRQLEGKPAIRFGVGIHTGLMMLGTVGEEERMDGTVISDAVNLASRLEGLTKVYGVVTIISRNTKDAMAHADRYRYRFLDTVRVKGKKDEIEIYEVLCPELVPEQQNCLDVIDTFEAGVAFYQNGDFAAARDRFQEVLDRCPDDLAAQVYRQRCDHFEAFGTPDNWQGVTDFDHK